MPASRVTILAGSKAFTSALARPIAERTGEAPRLAADPGQAFALCRAGSAVLVLEYEPVWASVLKDLARSAKGLRVVAALSPGVAEAEPALRALGVHSVRWVGDAAPVLDAIRPVGPAPGPAHTPAPGPAHTPAAGGFFRDVAAGDPPAAPAPAAAALWPSTTPGEEDAEKILCSALAGLSAAGDAALDATIEALTPLETEALQSLASIADPAPIRRLSALRYRLAFALSTAPAPGSPVDAGGGNLLLTEIDDALPALKQVAERLPDRHAEIDEIRNALVREAVDLSEALHRLQPGAVAAAGARPAQDPRRTTGRMRVDLVPEPARPGRSRTGMWVTFAIVVALGASFHAREYWLRRTRAGPAGVPGAPAGMVGAQAPAGPSVLLPGKKPVAPAELERFRNEQVLLGNEVTELPGGGVLVVPGRASPPPPTPEAR